MAAASNWRALSDFACRFAGEGCAFLIDIGSTTRDIIPLVNGKTVARGENDTQRLVCGELIYTGVERSPICGILQSVQYHGTCCGVAQEWFATTRDAYLLLGDLPEDANDRQTADGRGADKLSALARMGRMICVGDGDFDFEDGLLLAKNVSKAQEEMIAIGLRKQISSRELIPETFILSGQGEFVARRVLKRLDLDGRIVSISQKLGEHVSRCATAYALAVLTKELEETK
ncbi:MAG: hypothetical protein IIB28_00970 [Chloroflexi bacterium]|nr:hypothetical protein [Chloroflexota bacterium]